MATTQRLSGNQVQDQSIQVGAVVIAKKHGRWYGRCYSCSDEWDNLRKRADRDAYTARENALNAAKQLARQALATTEPEPTGMPELPEPDLLIDADLDSDAQYRACSVDLMRTYGEQCWKAGYDLGKPMKSL